MKLNQNNIFIFNIHIHKHKRLISFVHMFSSEIHLRRAPHSIGQHKWNRNAHWFGIDAQSYIVCWMVRRVCNTFACDRLLLNPSTCLSLFLFFSFSLFGRAYRFLCLELSIRHFVDANRTFYRCTVMHVHCPCSRWLEVIFSFQHSVLLACASSKNTKLQSTIIMGLTHWVKHGNNCSAIALCENVKCVCVMLWKCAIFAEIFLFKFSVSASISDSSSLSMTVLCTSVSVPLSHDVR